MNIKVRKSMTNITTTILLHFTARDSSDLKNKLSFKTEPSSQTTTTTLESGANTLKVYCSCFRVKDEKVVRTGNGTFRGFVTTDR